MVGFQCLNTLTANGTVTRGLCEEKDGNLSHIVEIQKIALKDGHAVYEENGEWKPIDDHALVSMNFWRIVSRKSIFFCIISNASEVQWSTLKSSISNDLLWILCIVLVELATVPTLYVSYSFHQ